jgi:multicomponent Na+:H+ antiporter subunit C
MTLLLAIAPAVLFGAGAYLLLRRDLIHGVAGIILVSNAATLFVMAAGLGRGRPPIHPVLDASVVSDPLVQAMTLTAIVIGFALSAFLVGLVYAVFALRGTIDQTDLHRGEVEEERRLARDEERAA